MPLEHYAQILGSIAGILVAFGTIYKYVAKPAVSNIKSFLETINKLDESLPILMEISHQFKPNGGNSLRDVIDRVERDLSLSKARTKILLGMSNHGVYEADHEGKCVWVNRKWTEIAGLLPEEALGNGWVTAIHPEDRDKVFTEWTNSIKAERDFDLVYRFKNRHTGKITLVHGHSTAFRNDKSKHLTYIGSISIVEEKEHG